MRVHDPNLTVYCVSVTTLSPPARELFNNGELLHNAPHGYMFPTHRAAMGECHSQLTTNPRIQKLTITTLELDGLGGLIYNHPVVAVFARGEKSTSKNFLHAIEQYGETVIATDDIHNRYQQHIDLLNHYRQTTLPGLQPTFDIWMHALAGAWQALHRRLAARSSNAIT